MQSSLTVTQENVECFFESESEILSSAAYSSLDSIIFALTSCGKLRNSPLWVSEPPSLAGLEVFYCEQLTSSFVVGA